MLVQQRRGLVNGYISALPHGRYDPTPAFHGLARKPSLAAHHLGRACGGACGQRRGGRPLLVGQQGAPGAAAGSAAARHPGSVSPSYNLSATFFPRLLCRLMCLSPGARDRSHPLAGRGGAGVGATHRHTGRSRWRRKIGGRLLFDRFALPSRACALAWRALWRWRSADRSRAGTAVLGLALVGIAYGFVSAPPPAASASYWQPADYGRRGGSHLRRLVAWRRSAFRWRAGYLFDRTALWHAGAERAGAQLGGIARLR